MKNILSRKEYLQSMNEGLIGDVAKKIGNGVKNLFKIGMKKIKDFITIFDNEGNVLPVVSAQASIEHLSNSNAVKISAPKSISDDIVAAGGKSVSQYISPLPDDDSGFGPSGEEYAEWVEDEKYKDTVEYKNLMRMKTILKEHFEATGDVVEESSTENIKNRVFYSTGNINGSSKTTGVDKLSVLNYDDFQNILNEAISRKAVGESVDTLFVFGAPGIGKSTIPNSVINIWNEKHSEYKDKMSLICVNCANIQPGDLMMPTIPANKDVVSYIERNSSAFPELSADLSEIDAAGKEELNKILRMSSQKIAQEAPKSWLPCYHATGDDELDYILDCAANGGLQTVENSDDAVSGKFLKNKKFAGRKKHYVTGGGGILLMDEFLRCKPQIFDELMNFLLTGEVNGWHIGSKWTIIACSNRPCDDAKVQEVWDSWGGAAKDRWARMYHLNPSPKEWELWAKQKGCDNIILNFIFDETAKDGSEYHRWHRMSGHEETGGDEGVKPVTPRNWERVFNAINLYKKEHKLTSMSQMSIDQVKKVISGYFDKDFNSEFIKWLNDHAKTVNIDEIIKNPETVVPPMGSDPHLICKDIYEQIKGKCEKKLLTDEEISKIFIWLGINYKGSSNSIASDIAYKMDKIYKNSSEELYISGLILSAAFPESTDIEGFREALEVGSKKVDIYKEKLHKYLKDPDNASIDEYVDTYKSVILNYAKKYFPWRVNGDELLYMDNMLDDLYDKETVSSRVEANEHDKKE